MRALKRNQNVFYLCPYQGKTALIDEYGNETGEHTVNYGFAVEYEANISPANGISQTEMFGNLDEYDKVISPLPSNFSITEDDVLFVDKQPEYDDNTGMPLFDYKVRRIARSINHTAVVIRKVTIS